MEESERNTGHGDKELITKRGATSVAWMWFGYEKSDMDQKTVLCKICRRPVLTTGSNTTNLFCHLRKIHMKQYGESLRMSPNKVQSSDQQTLDSDVARGFCPRHTIWQSKMEGDNSFRYNLHLQRHGPNLHGRKPGVSAKCETTQSATSSWPSLIHGREDVNWPRFKLNWACLITENPTRWGSMQQMIERVLEQESSLTGPPCRQENATSGPNLVGLGLSGVHEQGTESSHGVYRYLIWGAVQKCFLLETGPPSFQQPGTQASR
ncbi:unnamed protein product [Oncorhynchus mykiss]|uniref:BED-type domain-containing protein n=1 Tax=Oncorhynchus mykiss TaxID=8022 RepID=A0A060YE47_ONCMY|nr:unnamed protein product [Oncorhynchus mykiss]